MSETTAQIIERVALIPVLRARNAAQAHAVVKAMIAGGVTVVEVTMTVPGALDLLKELKIEFVVSPSLHPDVIAATKARKKLSIPGALTPTEVVTANRAGADYVKIFPCSAMGGASYLKSLLAPFPHLKLIPTGGVTHHTAASFLEAGAKALGVGSDLVNLAAIDQGAPEVITAAARAYLKIIAEFRNPASPIRL